jgi:hypothetical protein
MKESKWGGRMQMAITFMAIVAGLTFSIAVALFAEEWIFGQVFRLFFARNGRQSADHGQLPTASPKTDKDC